MRISDWSSDVCSSDLTPAQVAANLGNDLPAAPHRTANASLVHKLQLGGGLEFTTTFDARYKSAEFKRLNNVATSRVPTYARSEEHTSELQSLMRISYAVFCLKKKNNTE